MKFIAKAVLAFVVLIIIAVAAKAILNTRSGIQKTISTSSYQQNSTLTTPEPSHQTIAQKRGHKPELAKDRLELIKKLQSENLIGNVRIANHVGKMTATPKFMSLNYEDKQRYCGVVIAWCWDTDPETSSLMIIDQLTNKEIGSCDNYSGFILKIN